jgi:adenylylsulfate reductase subunit A
VVEKANIQRSGCLAAGVNAINACLAPGHQPGEYAEYARRDAEGIARLDLLQSMAVRLNAMVGELEQLGMVVQREADGSPSYRGWRNLRINGENLKPLLAQAASSAPGVEIVNRVNVNRLLVVEGRVVGAVGFSTREALCRVFLAPAVICATGGAAGLYRPNLAGNGRHALWYPPFNTGGGLAMGMLAGAEMTSLEMRFVALRCRDTLAPTGTLSQGAGARQVNARGEDYEERYSRTTQGRVWGTRQENRVGHGPCRLLVDQPTPALVAGLCRSYLNMAPTQVLKWAEMGDLTHPGDQPFGVELIESEPYVMGGHTGGGFWLDASRATTLPGLFAAGDVGGGCPQKYVSGAMAEGEIAAQAALAYVAGQSPQPYSGDWRREVAAVVQEAETTLARPKSTPYGVDDLSDALWEVMDRQAGGRGADYRYSCSSLALAQTRLQELREMAVGLSAQTPRDLLRVQELGDRLVVATALVAHLAARRETRWPGFGEYSDYPEASDLWQCFVNSRWKDGCPQIILRNLAGSLVRYVG